MIKSKPTVTIAVCAYNEQENIEAFLESCNAQKEDGFQIEQIWVHSDGSVDNTVRVVKSLRNAKVKLWEHKKRVGKATHLNQIYRLLKTDFLVQADADVIFAHKFVVRDVIEPLLTNPSVGMCGGNPEPLEGTTFWERICKVAFEPYQQFRSEVRGGNNAFSSVGQILAFKRELVKKITVPQDMITNDIYTYFCCLSLGYKYKFVKSAKVLFRSPQNLRDLIKQNTRFQIGCKRMFDLFEPQLVEWELSVPRWLLYKKLLGQFFKHPLHAGAYYLVNSYCRVKTSFMSMQMDARWPIAQSTKKLT